MKEIPYRQFSLRAHRKNLQSNRSNACQFELTFCCGLRCSYCYCGCYNAPGQRKKELSTAQVKKILQNVRSTGVLWLFLTGGDPLSRNDFLEIYRYAKRLGFIISIFTNGYSMTKEIAAYLKKAPPFVIEITLNAATEEVYEEITGVKGSFRKTISGIGLIRSAGLPLKLKSLVFSQNLDEIPRLKKYFKALEQRFLPSPDLFAALDKDASVCNLRVPPEDLYRLGLIKKERVESCVLPPGGEGERFSGQKKLFRCTVLSNDGFYIGPAGDIFLCNLIRKPSRNLLKTDIQAAVKELRSSARRLQFQTDSKCRECRKREFCSWCPGKAYLEKGNPESPLEYYCSLAKMTIKR